MRLRFESSSRRLSLLSRRSSPVFSYLPDYVALPLLNVNLFSFSVSLRQFIRNDAQPGALKLASVVTVNVDPPRLRYHHAPTELSCLASAADSTGVLSINVEL